MALIELEKIDKIYRGSSGCVKALKNISLSVEKGEFVAITGPSGSGKSTLMNIIGCLDRPTFGMYYLNGYDVSRMKSGQLARLRNRSVGFILQDCNLVSTLTAVENVWLPLYYRGISSAKRKAVACDALDAVGLSDRKYHLPRELSGGQRQRVAIARAIAASPDIILADEPTGSLDSAVGKEITGILRSLSENGRTVITVTHDHSLAASADRVITISNGSLQHRKDEQHGA